MSKRSEVFAACGKIVHAMYKYHTNAEIEKSNLQIISDARKVILAMIKEIAEACEANNRAECAPLVQSTLQDLNPMMNYSSDEKLIRDLGDICATLKSIEQGVKRSSRAKLLEAKLFSDHMKHGLASLRSM